MNFEVDAQEVIKELLEINKDLNLQLALIRVMYNQEKLKNKIDVADESN
jgi:hypothetical protein